MIGKKRKQRNENKNTSKTKQKKKTKKKNGMREDTLNRSYLQKAKKNQMDNFSYASSITDRINKNEINTLTQNFVKYGRIEIHSLIEYK